MAAVDHLAVEVDHQVAVVDHQAGPGCYRTPAVRRIGSSNKRRQMKAARPIPCLLGR